MQLAFSGFCPVMGGLIGSAVSDVMVRSQLGSTATRSCELLYYSSLTESSCYLTPRAVVISCYSRFSSEGIPTIEKFTFIISYKNLR